MKRYLSLLLITLCATGCVSVRQPPRQPNTGRRKPFSVRIARLKRLRRWRVEGAVGVVQPHDSESARFQWQQNGKSYTIHLAGALNVGSTTIQGGAGWVKVSRANGQHWQGKSPNALIASKLGWALPVQQLRYWIRGIPAPARYQQLRTDGYGHLQSLQQLGWTINWSRYKQMGAVDLPQWIVLQRAGWKIKVLARQWILN